jgi:hypothetical protein
MVKSSADEFARWIIDRTDHFEIIYEIISLR